MADVQARLASALADRYRIEREIGAGGMATVYLAEDLRHHRPVALKVLRPDLAATLGPDRFLREIEVAARLHHPHILPLYDSGEAGGFLFYVMPYEQGHSLRERLARETELPVADVVRLLHDVADALVHAHQSGLVHRDIKPENVLISGRHALVTDFGVAKAVSEATGGRKLTTIGVALGTPAYMAPEQAAADPKIDHRADIYALGVLGYELLTGRPPFTGQTPQAILAAQVTQSPTPVTELRQTVPAELAALVMRCLEKKPADRFQSAEELLPLLEALQTPSGGTTPYGTAPYRAAGPGRRRPLWVGAGVAALALVGWVGWRASRDRPLTIEVANRRQITRGATPHVFPAISPDGRQVAYQEGPPTATSIMVSDVAGGRPIVLTADWDGAQRLPEWSSDGAYVFFVNLGSADRGAGWWRIPRQGGQATRPDSADVRDSNRGATIDTVTADSMIFRSAQGRRMAKARRSTRTAVRPDGGAVAWMAGNADYVGTSQGNVAPSAIWVSVAGHEPVLVTDTTSLNASPAWLPDGTLLYVSDRDGARDVYAQRLDGSGRPRGTAVRLGIEAYSVSVSADGRTIAYDRLVLRRNIFAVPIPRAGAVSIREARPVTTGNQLIENLDLSADGRWLVFDSNLEGNQDIYVMPASGGEPRRVTRDAGDDFSPDFSPDGRQIVFHTTRNATRDIYAINIDGSGLTRLTSDLEQSLHPAFSPDGLRIAWGNSSERGGHWSVAGLRREDLRAAWVGPERLIEDAYAPRWSPDGTMLVADRRPGNDIVVLGADGRVRTVVAGDAAGLIGLAWPEWSEDGTRVYFAALDAEGNLGLFGVPLSGGTPRLLVRFDDPSRIAYTGTPVVGNGMFYMALGEIESDVWVADLVRP